LSPGSALLVMMKRAHGVVAALQARLGRCLPDSTQRHGALGNRKHADDRRDSLQNRSHISSMRYHREPVNARPGPDCQPKRPAFTTPVYWRRRAGRPCASERSARSVESRPGSVAAGTSKTSCVTCHPQSDATARARSRSWRVCWGDNPSRAAGASAGLSAPGPARNPTVTPE
jgi:hypothetical protein